ncbi:MAG: HypC/HybG/HupF family hydrogenase formation chaperone [Ktedonobacterales bacterium]|nr:HypC/HybG/HupF family hydrogenase formation chaperone [Ktedonobacterales bacterium]
MCIGAVGRVLERSGETALVMVGERRQAVNAALRPEAVPGDFVLIQTGLILDIISEAEARELERCDREIAAALDAALDQDVG